MKPALPSALDLRAALALLTGSLAFGQSGNARPPASEAAVPVEVNERTRRGARPAPTAAREPRLHFTPLTELGRGEYKGENGGLYGGGRNDPPKLHLDAALKAAAKIQPLDADGKPSPDGKIVLLCVGMSNTTMQFSRFKKIADADPEKPAHLILVDGAQGGKDARMTADREAPYWKKIEQRIAQAGVTPRQVQAIWFKQALISPREEFPAEAKRLQGYTATIMNICQERHPNVRLAYLSSRTYGGYATVPLNPEPFAYEDGFAVRWLIQDQIQGAATLNFDPANGAVKSPLLLWGPYLWADGETPRKADGFTYTIDDVVERDRTHPSESGQRKVAELLLKFFKTDATTQSWFLKAK